MARKKKKKREKISEEEKILNKEKFASRTLHTILILSSFILLVLPYFMNMI